MFKIEDLYVEDRKLGDLLKAIAGIARGMPRPVPVANIEETGRGLKAKSNGGNLVDVFTDHLIKQKISEFGPRDVQTWLVNNGYSKLSAYYITRNLRKSGVVKLSGKSSAARYQVIKHG